MPIRFGGVGAWRVRRNSVFSSNQDRVYEDPVVFSGVSGDGFFDHAGRAQRFILRSVRGWRFNASGILDREFSQNTVRLPACPAGDIVANSEKDGLNCLYSRVSLRQGAESTPAGTPDGFQRMMQKEYARSPALIREGGIRAE